MDLLRLATAGAVDDGKSTLIGRLLYDTRALFDDQVAAVQRASQTAQGAPLNLALITDGLRAEREQGITIDVAYRYFATPRRKFIIADTPGHVQYTRNMVTGASTAHLSLVLLDARHGPTEQSRRHVYLSHLLRVPHLTVCVNKMDLVGYDEARFGALCDEVSAFAAKLGAPRPTFIPACALTGGNVVTRAKEMPWYQGPTLLEHLEAAEVPDDAADRPLRLPVQTVLRPGAAPYHDYRACAGQLASGSLRPKDEVLCLPSGQRSRVAAVEVGGCEVDEAFAPMSVSVRLVDKLDVGRGEVLVSPAAPPRAVREWEAVVCWMAPTPLLPNSRYLLKHTTRTTKAQVEALVSRVDVNTLEPTEGPARLELNELGTVRLRSASPLCLDPYGENRTMGSFILIDESTFATVAAGVVPLAEG